METTKAFINDPDERIFLDLVAGRMAKPREQMIALIDRFNEERMIWLKE